MGFFETFYFENTTWFSKNSPNFDGSLNNFDRSDGDWKNMQSNMSPTCKKILSSMYLPKKLWLFSFNIFIFILATSDFSKEEFAQTLSVLGNVRGRQSHYREVPRKVI